MANSKTPCVKFPRSVTFNQQTARLMKNFTYPQQGGLWWGGILSGDRQTYLDSMRNWGGDIIFDDRGLNDYGGYGDSSFACYLRRLSPGVRLGVSLNCYSTWSNVDHSHVTCQNQLYDLADSTTGGWLMDGTKHIVAYPGTWVVDLRVPAMQVGYGKILREYFARVRGLDFLMLDECHESITFLAKDNGYVNGDGTPSLALWLAAGLPSGAEWKAAVTGLINEIKLPMIGNGNFLTAEYTPLWGRGQYRQFINDRSTLLAELATTNYEYTHVPAIKRFGTAQWEDGAKANNAARANGAYIASILARPYQVCSSSQFGVWDAQLPYDFGVHGSNGAFGTPIGFTPGVTTYMPAHTTVGGVISREFTNATVSFNTNTTTTDGMASMTGKVVWN